MNGKKRKVRYREMGIEANEQKAARADERTHRAEGIGSEMDGYWI